MKAYDVVVVEWDDALSIDAWLDAKEIERRTLNPLDGVMQVVGFLLHDLPEYVVIAAAMNVDKEDRKFSDTWRVPRAAIRSVRTIEFAEIEADA